MKIVIFDYADTYIESVEAFISTVEVTDIKWFPTWVAVIYK